MSNKAVAGMVNEGQMWNGIREFEVTVEHRQDMIDVTSFNDPEPKFIAGLKRSKYEVTIRCDRESMELLWAAVHDKSISAPTPAEAVTVIDVTNKREITLPD